jgi:prepilin-type N-terminal cleavage/methylation domain-containing protein
MLTKLRKRRGDESAFTLIECLFAMVLLLIGILALSAAQVTYFKSTLQSHMAFEANTLADQAFEAILSDPGTVAPATVSSSCGSSSETFEGRLCRTLSDAGTGFMNDTTIDVQLIDAVSHIWRVTVNWSSLGVTHSITKDIGLAS